jgi:tungstate transport system substrate-binding protein
MDANDGLNASRGRRPNQDLPRVGPKPILHDDDQALSARQRTTSRARRRPTMKRLACVLLVAPLLACSGEPHARLILATTSSADDSGLVPHLITAWAAQQAPPAVHVLVVGSGEALTLGARGDADVLLVHAPEDERVFMENGLGALRLPVMSNAFLVVGPATDPAGVRTAADVLEAVRRIAAAGTFVSRGDDSGTHKRELHLRAAAALPVPPPRSARNLEVGQGMGEALRMASERQAYTLTDRATWEVWRARLDLVEFAFHDALLENRYSVIVPVTARDTAAAARFARWLAGPRAQAMIAAFRGRAASPLFAPAAAPAHEGPADR